MPHVLNLKVVLCNVYYLNTNETCDQDTSRLYHTSIQNIRKVGFRELQDGPKLKARSAFLKIMRKIDTKTRVGAQPNGDRAITFAPMVDVKSQ